MREDKRLDRLCREIAACFLFSFFFCRQFVDKRTMIFCCLKQNKFQKENIVLSLFVTMAAEYKVLHIESLSQKYNFETCDIFCIQIPLFRIWIRALRN